MTTLQGAHVLVAGSSRSIGAGIAREMAARGARVSVVARNKEQVERVAAEIGGFSLVADLTDPVQLGSLIERAEDAAGPLDILINNAAAVVPGRFAALDAPDITTMVNTCLVAPAELMRQALGRMLPRGKGMIVNVSSINGDMSVPNTAVYCASKAGLSMLTMTLQRELRGTQVQAMLVVLGEVADTGLVETIGSDPVVSFVAKRLERLPRATVKDVATKMADAIERDASRLVIPWAAIPMVQLRHLPSRAFDLFLTGLDNVDEQSPAIRPTHL